MVKRCGNSSCREEFKPLNGGDLYALERRSANTEFFWLCSACACAYELYLDPTGCVSVRVWNLIHRAQPPHPDANLRLISRHDETPAKHAALRRTSFYFCVDRRAVFRGFPYARRPGELNCARGPFFPRSVPRG